MPLYTGRVCGRPTSARIYIVVACVVAVAKNIHVTVTRGPEYKSVPVCSNGSLRYQTVLDDVCGYPNDEYMVGIQSARTEASFFAPCTNILTYLLTYVHVYTLRLLIILYQLSINSGIK